MCKISLESQSQAGLNLPNNNLIDPLNKVIAAGYDHHGISMRS